MSNQTWYVVLHEYTLDDGRGNTRVDTNVCSSLHESHDTAENALAYCEGMQSEGRPGADGRYFIAKVTA